MRKSLHKFELINDWILIWFDQHVAQTVDTDDVTNVEQSI